MANDSLQQNTTSSFEFFSSSYCIAWMTVYGVEAVAIVILNVLTIIIYLKDRSLRKRSLYLVINLAVADMLAPLTATYWILRLGNNCQFGRLTCLNAMRSTLPTKFCFIYLQQFASLILILPFIIFWFISCFVSHDSLHQTWLHLYNFLFCLCFANSLINPALYAFQIPEFKRALFSLVRCRSRSGRVQVFPLNDM
ncbi:uncharacterized protein [Montipora capricornis]|uniref:uncharacterized protein n=1 Tax=Montipora capricornis TaxID=246305 RepID=UPI0035F1827E